MRRHTMAKFLTHESLAAGAWNRDYCAASNSMQQWSEVLMNQLETVHVAIDRMESDWLAMKPTMRKAHSLKDVDARPQSVVPTGGE